jgi:polyferredoxin
MLLLPTDRHHERASNFNFHAGRGRMTGMHTGVNILATSRDMNLALVLMVGFVACWLLALTAFVKAYSNVQPGVKWWCIWLSNERDALERTFTPKGQFWLKVAKAAVIAGFALAAIVTTAARWWR